MFCTNCGQELSPGASFCPECGTAVASQAGLPEGIVSDETGVLQWEYEQNMWTNPVHLYLLLKLFFIVSTCVLAFIGIIGVLVADFTFGDVLFACALIYGTSFVLCLLGVAFVNLYHGGKNYYEFVMGEEGVMHIANRKTFQKIERLMDAGAVIGTVTGDANMVGASLTGRSNTYAMKFSEVKKIYEHRANDYIEIYGGLFNYNHIYAYPHQYDFVLGYIKAHCPQVIR